MDGERSLACAVVQQAILDALASKPEPPTRESAKSTATYKARLLKWKVERAEGIRFLSDDHGEWRASRERWCALAGVDPDSVRERYLAGRLVRSLEAA